MLSYKKASGCTDTGLLLGTVKNQFFPWEAEEENSLHSPTLKLMHLHKTRVRLPILIQFLLQKFLSSTTQTTILPENVW